ncbi:MAG: hypothetical protein K0S23_3611 [Fluviicola sp.]|uniref:T9SS type A sorting domain-containing protein n=1 Tax=Fluviicola sp. TaxID=1917219 RepID=UPI002603A282|nr:T9SS type A sorting domain-containing protein [Fluviicola sp.]MDF3029304.1 hypothetical protein [Fluviicola sp.]
MNRLFLITLIFLSIVTSNGFAQTIVSDLSFNIGDTTEDIFEKGIDFGINTDYRALVVQSDGKIVIGGDFMRYNEETSEGIARLNKDGSLDHSFHASTAYPGGGFAIGAVNDIAIQADGKIIVAGTFGHINGVERNRVARLNADGSLDASFDAGEGPNNFVNRVYIQPDGKIILLGLFSHVSQIPQNGIVRLNTDGSIDNSFQIPTGFTFINDIAFQPDGKILIASTYDDGSTTYRVPIRLNTDGSIDNTFGLLQSTNNTYTHTYSLALQQNGKILVGGAFAYVTGIGNYQHFVRLNPDGSIDNTFNIGTGPNSLIGRIQVNSQDEILITPTNSGFENYDGHVGTVAYLNADGSYKPMFYGSCPPQGTPSGVRAGFASNGNILFTSDILYQLYSLRPNGGIDPTFNCQTGVGQKTNLILEQPDGKIMIGGVFSTYNGKACSHLARLSTNGTMDSVFNANIGLGPTVGTHACSIETDNENSLYLAAVKALTIQPDGKYLIGGEFQHFNGLELDCPLVRLNADGTLDTGFQPSIGYPTSDARSIHVLSDNKILVTMGGGIYRLHPDGYTDNTYTPVAVNGMINASVLQPDEKLVIVGDFTGQSSPYMVYNHISRLNPNGSIDYPFYTNIGSGAGGFTGATINTVILQPDGKLFLSGHFSTFNGVQCQSRIRLNSDGTVDPSFHVSAGDTIQIHSAALNSDGGFLLVGNFDPDQEELTGMIKIDQNGDLDNTWDLHQSFYRFISNLMISIEEKMTVAIQSDGKVLVGGAFTDFNGTTRNGLVRLATCYPIYATQNVTEQFTYTWPVNGQTYLTSGQYIDTMSNSIGCDSIVTLNLTITHMSVSCFSSPSYVDSCTGVVNLTAGGTPDFTFDIGTGTTVTSSQYAVFDSLCPGIYSIQVTDGNGDTLNTTFVVPSDSTYLIVDPFSGTATDSSVIAIENCVIDYNSIDSIYIDSYTILSGDSVLINWAVIDINGTTIIPSILVLTPGNIYIQLQLYCSTKSIDEYFVATIGINYDGNRISTLNVIDEELDLFTIYPNPTNDQVHISFSGSEAELTVYDLQGKVVLKDKIQNNGLCKTLSAEFTCLILRIHRDIMFSG